MVNLTINKISKFWIDDQNLYHRLNAPAFEYHSGQKYWYQHGKLHRLDGPAKNYSNLDKSWYYQGQIINCSSQEEFERWLKLRLLW